MTEDIGPYFSGARLWGDDFSQAEIEAWFDDEAEASIGLKEESLRGEYPRAAQQDYHCFSRIPQKQWRHILGFGSAFGAELKPLDAQKCTIVESSPRYEVDGRLGFPVSFVAALPSGDIALADASVDLIVCLGTLHHIPNVNHVLGEFGRVCEEGGFAVIVEPIISMGDWRRPRPGLTPRERGIPTKWMTERLQGSGFRVERVGLCDFPVTNMLWRITGHPPFNSRSIVVLDATVCKAFARRWSYHAVTRLQRLRPTSAAYVAVRT